MSFIAIFAILATCVGSTPLNTHQAVLWQGQSTLKTATDTPITYTATYPISYSTATHQRTLTFGGFSFRTSRKIAFSASISSQSASGDTILFSIQDDFRVVYIVFYILLADTSCSWLWLEQSVRVTGTIDTPVGIFTSAPSTEQYTHALSRTISTPSDMNYLIFLKDFSCYGPGLTRPQIAISARSLTSNSIDIEVDRSSKFQAVYSVSSTLLIFNITEINSNVNITYNQYTGSVSQFSLSSSSASNFFSDMGIDGQYAMDVVQFNRLCFMGLKHVGITDSQNSVFEADLSVNPIARSSSITRGSGPITMNLDYSAVCLRLYYCDYNYGFDNCMDCNSTNCLQCVANHSVYSSNGQDYCYYDNCWADFGYADCIHCNSSECLVCGFDFYLYVNGSHTICATNSCLFQFNFAYCTECTHRYCLACLNAKFTLTDINGTAECVTSFCLEYFNMTSCVECTGSGCLQCEANFTMRDVAGVTVCVGFGEYCTVNLSISNCSECTGQQCLLCETGFYPLTVNSTGYCGTQFCETWLNYPQCQQCIFSQCLSCKSNFYFKTVNSTEICVTRRCQSMFNFYNCFECTSTTCFQCELNFYHSTVNGYPTCVTSTQCSMAFGFDNCQECYALKCLQCMADFYPVVVGTTEYCATDQCMTYFGIDNCGECTVNGCLQCGANFTLEMVNSQPVCFTELCPELFGMVGCNKCTATKCYRCSSGFYLQNNKCLCLQGGTLVNGMCQTVEGCLTPTRDASGKVVCAACNETYFKMVDNQCVCLKGELVNGVCNTIAGCLVPILDSTAGIVCKFCNITAKFTGTPVSGQCSCQDYHHLDGVSSTCIQTCGDGVLLSLSVSSCDDGNTADLDGCSSTCQVQPLYRCNNTIKGRSKCFYTGVPIDLTKKYTERQEQDVNRVVMTFELIPDLFPLKDMDFNTHTQLTCSIAGIEMVSAKYSHGLLTIAADFTEDIEGVSCSVNITYDAELMVIQNSYLLFNITSGNGDLFYLTAESVAVKKSISFIFTVISYVVLALFLASLRHKMIGVELIFTTQVVYLSYGFSSRPSYLGEAIKKMEWVSGYRQLFYVKGYGGSFREEYGFCWQFMQNNVVWVGVVAVVVGLMLTVKVHSIIRADKMARQSQEREEKQRQKQKQQQRQKQKQQQKQKQTRKKQMDDHFKFTLPINYLYTFLLFPFVTFNLTFLLLTAYFDLTRTNSSSTFTDTTNSLILLLGTMVAACVVGIQGSGLGQKGGQERIAGVHEMKKCYIAVFISRIILFSLLLVIYLYLQSQYIIWSILALSLTYLLFILFYRPYNSIFSNISLLTNQLTLIYSIGLAIMHNHIEISFDDQANLLLVVQALLLLCAGLAFVRLGIYYYELLKLGCCQSRRGFGEDEGVEGVQKKKKVRGEDRNQVELSLFNSLNPYKGEEKPSLMTVNKGTQRRPLRQKAPFKSSITNGVEPQRVVHAQEEDREIQEIKARLRKDLLQHRKKYMVRQEIEQ